MINFNILVFQKDCLRDDEREINHHGTTLNVGGDDVKDGGKDSTVSSKQYIIRKC